MELTDLLNDTIVRSLTTTELEATFGDLDPYRNYSVSVTATNDADFSTLSEPKVYETQQIGKYLSVITTQLFHLRSVSLLSIIPHVIFLLIL